MSEFPDLDAPFALIPLCLAAWIAAGVNAMNSPNQGCRCLIANAPDWTPWQPSMWSGVTDTRFCRRCSHRVYRMREQRTEEQA